MKWVKEKWIELLGVLIALLTYFGIAPSDLVRGMGFLAPAVVPILYMASGILIGWGLHRAASGVVSFGRRDTNFSDEEFKSDFEKVPFWVKVFFKTLLDKSKVYGNENDYGFEMYREYLLNFVEYSTVSRDTRRYKLIDAWADYFKKNPDLLEDVSEEDIRSHARPTKGIHYIDSYSSEFSWWYYSDDDCPDYLKNDEDILDGLQ